MSILFSSLLLLNSAQAAEPKAVDCSYDLDAMLQLNHNDFDQGLDGGWRKLSDKGCDLEAAELIREWRFHKRSHSTILYWHEGQLRANEEQTDQAIELFRLTYNPQDHDEFGWNYYVDGTIAFLSDDRESFDRAIKRLKALPSPENRPSFTLPDGSIRQMNWPPNLHVLGLFQTCWGESYKKAYTGCKETAKNN